MPNQNPPFIVFAIGLVAGGGFAGFAGLATRYAVNRNGEGANNLDIALDSFVVAATLAFCACLCLNESRGISEEARRRAEEALRSTHERSSVLCNVLEKIAKADSEFRLANIIQNIEIIEMSLVQSGLEDAKIQEIKKLLNLAFTCRENILTIEDVRMLASNDLRVFPEDLRDQDVAKDFLELNFDGEGNQDETRESIREFIKKVQQPNVAGINFAAFFGIASSSSSSRSSSFDGRLV